MIIPLLIAAFVFLVALWRPRYGLAAIILLWPAYLLRLDVFGIPTTALELAIYAVAVAVVILLILKKLDWHRVKITKWSWLLLTTWIIAWLVATVYSADRTAALGAVKAWLVDPLIFSTLLVFLIRNETDRRQIIQAAIVSGVMVALYGLYQIIWLRETLQDGRLSSFFHPVANYAAMYLVPLIILNSGLLLHGYIRGLKWWLSLGLMLLAIAITMSYGGFLALAAGGIFIWAYLPAGKFKSQLALGAVIIGAVTVLLLSTTNNFSEHFKTSDRSSGLVRTQIWATSWALIKQHPLVGIGPNNFETAYRAELPKHYYPPLEWLVAQPHNLYLALWLELGLLGLLIFLGGLVGHFFLARRQMAKNTATKAVTIAGLAALVAVLVHGLVDTPYFKNDLVLILALLLMLPQIGKEKLE